MMILPLLIIDILLYRWIVKDYRHQRENGPYPENCQYDQDMQDLWNLCPEKLCEGPDPYIPVPCKVCRSEDPRESDSELKARLFFSNWLENEHKLGLKNLEQIVIVNGIPLQPGNEDDMEVFLKAKDQAYAEGMFHSKNLNEGGREELYTLWLQLKGCSPFGAKTLLSMDIKPWEFDLE